jgi:hypothetical protein
MPLDRSHEADPSRIRSVAADEIDLDAVIALPP